jgi:hypothetical protein
VLEGFPAALLGTKPSYKKQEDEAAAAAGEEEARPRRRRERQQQRRRELVRAGAEAQPLGREQQQRYGGRCVQQRAAGAPLRRLHLSGPRRE